MSVRAYRVAMVSGASFALLLAFGSTMIFGPTPNTKNNSADQVATEWAKFLADSGHRTSVIVGSFLLALAAVAFIWFASALHARFAGPGSPLMPFAVLAAAAVGLSMTGPLAIVGGHTFGEDPIATDGHAIWLVFSLQFPVLLVMFGLASSAFIATLMIAGRGVLPMWLVVFGWLAVVAGLFGVLFIPMIIVVLWYLVAGVYGTIRPAVAVPAGVV